MNRHVKIFTLAICLIVITVFGVVSYACPYNPNCNSNVRTAHCGGEKSRGYGSHNVIYTDTTFPFIHSETCRFTEITHSTYGKCGGCGATYPSGANIFSDHALRIDHTGAHCNAADDPICSHGQNLGW